jgi:hypothetical protein
MASAAGAGPQRSGSGKSEARVPPEFESSKFSLNLHNGAERFMSAHTNRSAATTGPAVLSGRSRINWPRTKWRTWPGENWNIVPKLPYPDANS